MAVAVSCIMTSTPLHTSHDIRFGHGAAVAVVLASVMMVAGCAATTGRAPRSDARRAQAQANLPPARQTPTAAQRDVPQQPTPATYVPPGPISRITAVMARVPAS